MFFPALGPSHMPAPLPGALSSPFLHGVPSHLLILAQLTLPPGLLSAQVILCYCILFSSEHLAQLSPLIVVC